MKIKNIDVDLVKNKLDYNPDTGILKWKNCNNKLLNGRIAGSKRKTGYIFIVLNFEIVLAHRVAWCSYYGKNPNGLIDHINGDTHDNRISNLREVDNSTNMKNATIYSKNTSGVSGVSMIKKTKRFEARIQSNGVSEYLGVFATVELAKEARLKAEKRLGFHENHGRKKLPPGFKPQH